jgi:NADPH:quinone reductase-like Zn-dependent oxidoreductase
VKTLYFNKKGKADEVLKLGENTIPDLLPNEVRVKIKASPINPADFMFIERVYRVKPVFPQIAGFEGVGTITDNNGDKDFPVGSLVAFRSKNIWAEFANIPKDKIVLLPQGFSITKAAQLSLNPLTAWALLEECKAKENEWIILSAGNSAVSKLIIQFAKNKGIRTISVVRNDDSNEELLSLGANLILRSDNDNIEEQIETFVKNGRISGFLDAVGGDLTSKIIKIISPDSYIIHYGLYGDQSTEYYNSDIIFKNLTIKGFGIDAWINSKTKTEMKQIWINIIQEIVNRGFKMKVSGKYPLENYKEAIKESRKIKDGKILFWMD